MTKNRIGIRKEDKNVWERRVALTPDDMKPLADEGLVFMVERFERRAFPDAEYEAAGAELTGDVRGCELVLGIKEMPLGYFAKNGAYMFFSHTIKGQHYNMEMLAELVEKGCTLLDYETVTDEAGRRLIFFGRYAGIAGMIDTLWTLGRRLSAKGVATPFDDLEPTHEYDDLDAAKAAVAKIGERIAKEGLPAELAPLTIGVTGYGHVSKGAQEIAELMPFVRVAPSELAGFVEENKDLTDKIVITEYREEDLVRREDSPETFDLQDYYDHGERYVSTFEPHLSLLTVLVNGIYWEEKYPKLGDADQLKKLFAGGDPKLLAVGDVTCDIDGSLACTVRDTGPGDPSFVYDPATREAPSGFEGPGLAVMAVGNLPCELPKEASGTFSHALTPFLPRMAAVDWSEPDFEKVPLPDPIKRSVILWRGDFTPRYEYMREFLK